MIPKIISGANMMFGAPPGHVEDVHGPIANLPVRKDGDVYMSAWEMTPDELARLNAGGLVIVHVLGIQPAINLSVTEPAEMDFPPEMGGAR